MEIIQSLPPNLTFLDITVFTPFLVILPDFLTKSPLPVLRPIGGCRRHWQSTGSQREIEMFAFIHRGKSIISNQFKHCLIIPLDSTCFCILNLSVRFLSLFTVIMSLKSLKYVILGASLACGMGRKCRGCMIYFR